MTSITVGKSKESKAPEEEAHSPLGPSASDRWLNCLGSVLLTADMPGTESDYAAEGTAAHELSERCRLQGKKAKYWLGEEIHAQGKRIPVTWEMVHAVQEFVDYTERLDGDPYYEERVHYTAFVPNGWGTADDIRMGDTTIVTDLKYGKGIQVWAKDNPQLKLYALGVFQDFGHLYDIKDFKLVIHQPRLSHVDEWDISVEDLLLWARDVVVPAAERALKPGASFKAGPWCRFCPAKNACHTRNEYMQELYLSDLDVHHGVTSEELGMILDRVPLIRSWCTDMEKHGLSELNHDRPPIGKDGPYKLVEGRSARKWKNEAEAEKSMRATRTTKAGKKIKVADLFSKKLISVTVAEKLFGKDSPIIKEQVIKPAGKPTLVPASDRREPMKVKAEDEFDDLEDNE